MALSTPSPEQVSQPFIPPNEAAFNMVRKTSNDFKACLELFEAVVCNIAKQTGLEIFKKVFAEILTESLDNFKPKDPNVQMKNFFQDICLSAASKGFQVRYAPSKSLGNARIGYHKLLKLRDGATTTIPELREYLEESFADRLYNSFRIRADLKPLPSPVGLIVGNAGLFDDAARATLRDASRIITLSGKTVAEHERLANNGNEGRLVQHIKVEADSRNGHTPSPQPHFQEATGEFGEMPVETANQAGANVEDLLRKEQRTTAKLRRRKKKLRHHMF